MSAPTTLQMGWVMKRHDLDAVIIDLDGTLVDTVGDFELALNAMLVELGGGQQVQRAFIQRTVGKGSEYLVAQTLAAVGLPAARFEEAIAHYQRHYRRINGQASALFPGVAEGVAALQAQGLKLACLTNKPAEPARALLALKGLAGAFAHTFGGDDFARKKPDPLPLIETCKALGTAPRRTLMLGDSANDVAAARAAGCPVVLVSYGYNHGESAASANPDAVVDTLTEVAQRLALLG